jgi:hypothetical protein
MTDDAKLVTIAALGLGLALVAGMLAHTKADDRVRADLAGCKAELATEREVSNACMAVVEQCRAIVESNACACWRVE